VQPFESIILEGFFISAGLINNQKEEIVMKSGVIIYVAGNAPQDWAEENETSIRNLVSQADAIEIITTKTGHVDVSDAWRALLLKGMAHISCKMAIFSKSGEIELTGKETRLCG
jgi:hypothetical protein